MISLNVMKWWRFLMPSHKIERIASDMSRYISEILANEASDSLLKTVTVTGCKVTNDLSFCKVYFTSLANLDKTTLERELNEASSYIRGEVSKRIEIRHTPEIKFVYDESIEYGKKIDDIISSLN